MILPHEYYLNEDVLFLSRDLIGKSLFTKIDGAVTGGIIVETEAYRAPEDRASHAYNFRRTARNEMMYAKGGVCYIYRCYGIHSLFNIVTNQKDMPHAILVRAIQPVTGIDTMLQRRKKSKVERTLTAGPGAMSQALGIEMNMNGTALTGDSIWIEEPATAIPDEEIVTSPRVGIDYAGPDALLPWRFRIKNSPWTSR